MFLWWVMEVEQLFMYLWTLISFVKGLFKYFAHFSTGLPVDWACRWSVYFLESSLLLLICFINISFQCDLPFTFLGCFGIPQFLILIWSSASLFLLMVYVYCVLILSPIVGSCSCFPVSFAKSFIVLFSTLTSIPGVHLYEWGEKVVSFLF